jgi:hypothetical protein
LKGDESRARVDLRFIRSLLSVRSLFYPLSQRIFFGQHERGFTFELSDRPVVLTSTPACVRSTSLQRVVGKVRVSK